MNGSRYWINGQPGTQLDVADRALQYGDGVFETLRIRNAKPEYLALHLQRLRAGCERLGFPGIDWQTLRRELHDLAAQHDGRVMKIILSRGSAGRGYRPAPGSAVTRIVSIHALPEQPDTAGGVRVRICTTRLGYQPLLAGIKHLNRLEQVLGRMECEGRWQEGLMRDPEDNIVEGTMSNLFLVSGDRLVTPSLARAGVEGITRARILAIARRMGIHCDIRDVNADELATIDGMFVCNSLIGIWPVTRFEGRSLPIGDLTGELQQRLLESMCAEH